MSGEVFNDAMQMARQALISNNLVAFEAALQLACTAYPNHSGVGQHLQQASAHFPTSECLWSLSEACMIVAQAEFNGEVDAVSLAHFNRDSNHIYKADSSPCSFG